MATDQKTFESEKSRLLNDFQINKNRYQEEMKEKELEFQRHKEELIFDKNDIIHDLKIEFKERIAIIENKNQVSVNFICILVGLGIHIQYLNKNPLI